LRVAASFSGAYRSLNRPKDQAQPAATHQCLQVILPCEALRHRTVVAGVVVDLLADDGSAGNEVLQRLLR
jgi:hypothetical protein